MTSGFWLRRPLTVKGMIRSKEFIFTPRSPSISLYLLLLSSMSSSSSQAELLLILSLSPVSVTLPMPQMPSLFPSLSCIISSLKYQFPDNSQALFTFVSLPEFNTGYFTKETVNMHRVKKYYFIR